MDCSLPGSSVHGIFQARILEWVAISFSRRSSRPRDWTQVFCVVGRRFTVWATGKSKVLVGFQITWGHVGLSECKLFSLRRTFSRAFHLLCLENYLFVYWKLVGLQCWSSHRRRWAHILLCHLPLVWSSLGPSMLQMVIFHSFLWLSNIPLSLPWWLRW